MNRRSYVKYYDIPDVLGEREMEHILSCELCYQLFPLHYFHRREQPNWLTQWMEATEETRKKWVTPLQQEHQAFLKPFLKSHSPTGYQLFLIARSQNTHHSAVDSTRESAALWQQMADEQKRPFEIQAQLRSQEFQLQQKQLPEWIQKQIRDWKKERKEKREKRPPTAFVLFSRDQWQHARLLGADYRQFQQEVAATWRTAASSVRERYHEIAGGMADEYFARQSKTKRQTTTLESDSE